jgi:hypothetical protein
MGFDEEGYYSWRLPAVNFWTQFFGLRRIFGRGKYSRTSGKLIILDLRSKLYFIYTTKKDFLHISQVLR